MIDPKLRATFYLWFDKQALQLRFNLISGHNSPLPFTCQLNVLNSPNSILCDFLTTARQVAFDGDDIEFFDPSADIDDDEQEQILDVYVASLGFPGEVE